MHDGDVVRVDKELYGDVFRRPPKLTRWRRAIRLAIEYVGPTIAADAHFPKRVRKKLEETFGRFDLAGTPEPRDASDEEALVKVLSEAAEKRLVVEIEYLKEGEESPSPRRAVHDRARAACVASAHWDQDGGRGAYVPPRPDAVRRADDHLRRETGSTRPTCGTPGRAPPPFARDRWKLERGASALTDGSALADVPYKTEDWLLSEILADRGETTVLEPQRLRDLVAKRARRLKRELGRVPARR